jgi:hypothetical protein
LQGPKGGVDDPPHRRFGTAIVHRRRRAKKEAIARALGRSSQIVVRKALKERDERRNDIHRRRMALELSEKGCRRMAEPAAIGHLTR